VIAVVPDPVPMVSVKIVAADEGVLHHIAQAAKDTIKKKPTLFIISPLVFLFV